MNKKAEVMIACVFCLEVIRFTDIYVLTPLANSIRKNRRRNAVKAKTVNGKKPVIGFVGVYDPPKES